MKMKSIFDAPFSKWWIPYFILFSGLLATFGTIIYIARATELQDNLRFTSSIDQIQESVNDRLNTYTSLLQASAGLFDASENVTSSEFKNFSDRLKIRDVYPGIQGIGYLRRFTNEDISMLPSLIVQNGAVPFMLNPSGVRDEYYPILFIEPLDTRNMRAAGYDMFTERVRRATMERARDTAKPALSSKVTLIQETGPDKQAGFLLYVPLYSGTEIPRTVAERRAGLVGFVYSPFRADDFFNGVLGGKFNQEIDFKVYDTSESSETLLHDSARGRESDSSVSPSLTELREVLFAGEQWVFVFSTRPVFDRQSDKDYLLPIFIGGILMSIILFSLSQLQYRARRIAEAHSEEIKKSELALLRSNNRTNDILESITDGFIAFDRKWRFTYVNHEAARILGKTYQELIGKTIWGEFPEFDRSPFGKMYRKARRLNKPLLLEDYFEPFAEWFSVRAYPTKTGLSLYFQNISVRKEIERRKDEFISIASHELKTPVTSIKAFTQILQKTFNRDKKAGLYLTRMDEQINKLTLLINDLLDVSRMQSGKIELRMEKFSLSKLVQSTVETLQEVNPKRVISYMGDQNVVLTADEDRIGQVLVNLINNGIKYSGEATSIEVTLTRERTRVVVSVRDLGVGIEKQYIKKVFERFFRVSPVAERSDAGLGMGLYISSQIIKRHSGEMWVESVMGTGSIFYFSLPLGTKA